MVREEIIKRVEEYVESCSKNNEPGHDFSHIQRVRKIAINIANSLNIDTFLVELIALLHDIEDHKLNSNSKVSDFLSKIDLEQELKDSILYILPYLSFSKYPTLPDDFPIEGKVVSDADRLDAIGAVGIARAFSYGASHHRSFKDTLKHFDEKLLVLDQYLYFEKSKELAKERMKFLEEFYEELKSEL